MVSVDLVVAFSVQMRGQIFLSAFSVQVHLDLLGVEVKSQKFHALVGLQNWVILTPL